MGRTTRRTRIQPDYATIALTEATADFDLLVVTTATPPFVWRVGQRELVGASVNFTALDGVGSKQVVAGPLSTFAKVSQVNMNADEVSWFNWRLLHNLSSLVQLHLTQNQLAGDVSAKLGCLLNMTHLYLYTNQLTGVIPPELSNLTGLVHLYLTNNQLTGGIPAALGDLSNLTVLNLGNNQLSGDLPAELGNLSSLLQLHLYTNQLGSTEAGALHLDAIQEIFMHHNAMTEAEVDSAIDDVYAYRASYTDATPELNVGGTNAAPSGVYQDATPPTTGLEKVFKLANDPDAEGFNTWAITWNGGAAP